MPSSDSHGSPLCLTGWEMSGTFRWSWTFLTRQDNWACSLMSSWVRPTSSADWTSSFPLLPGLLLCSGLYKNSPAITKECRARAPENTGSLISAVKVSQAEFNEKSKVAKLDKNDKACDCLSTSSQLYVCDQKWLHYVSCQQSIDFWARS